MPTRIFDQFDLINVINGFTAGPNNPATNAPFQVAIDFNVSFINPSSFGFSGSNSTFVPASTNSEGCRVEAGSGTYEVSADVDFDNFPAIPDGSLINAFTISTSFIVRITAEVSGRVHPVVFPNDIFVRYIGNIPGTSIFFEEETSVTNPFSCDVGSAVPVIYNNVYDTARFISEFGVSALTKQQLVDNFSNFLLQLQISSGPNPPLASSGTFANAGINAASEMELTFQYTNWSMTVTYGEPVYLYSINPSPGSEVEVGQQIVITSPGTDPLVDLNLNEVTLLLNDVPTEIDYQDEQTLIFTVPNIVGPMEIEVVGNGVQFSGSITLGVLTVLLIAASGIYTLVPNKVNDTLYKSIRDGTTRDVKIPNPFAKTGFIGG